MENNLQKKTDPVNTLFEDEFHDLFEFSCQRHPRWKIRLFELSRLNKLYLDNDPNYHGLAGGTLATCPARKELIGSVKLLASDITPSDIIELCKIAARQKTNPANPSKIDGQTIAMILLLRFIEKNRPGRVGAKFIDSAFADIWREHTGHRFAIDGQLRDSSDLSEVLRKLRGLYFRQQDADLKMKKSTHPF